MLSSDLVHHCFDYQKRVGLKNNYFSVYPVGNRLHVIVSCENRLGDLVDQDLYIDVNGDIDECVYRAVMICTDMLAASQTTIH